MRRRPLVRLFGALTISVPCFTAATYVQAAEVEVLATASWQSTDMKVKKGTNYGVWQTDGSWTVDYRYYEYVDGAGYSPQTDAQIYQGCKHKGKWPYGLLLGRIGNNVFPIGRGTSFKASKDGTLELGIHDGSMCLQDNAGSLHVKIQKGLDVQDVLDELFLNQLRNLTTAERKRLALIAKNIAACSKARANPFSSTECHLVILGLISLLISPEPVE